MKNPQSTTAYSLLSNTVHLPIFSDGLKYHSTGQLSSVSYSLTLEASSKIEWYFPCMCKKPKRQTQASSITEKPTHESTANAYGTISFLSLS